jgi:tetratricopeptide (TPR) repeat protein
MKYVIGILAICAGLILFYVMRSEPVPFEILVREARKSLRTRDLETAEPLLKEALKQQPDSGEVLLLAAEVEMRREEWTAALEFLAKIKDDQPEYAQGMYTEGEIHRTQLHLFLAEQAYEQCLVADSEFVQAHQRLAYLKRLSGRNWAAEMHLRHLLLLGQIPGEQLAWLAAPKRLVDGGDLLQPALAAVPDDPIPLYGLGMIAMQHGDLPLAKDLFRQGLAIRSDAEILAQLGACLLADGDTETVNHWIERVSDDHRKHPEIQYIFGLIAEGREREDIASEHFVACLRELPFHKGALTHLASLMKQNSSENAKSLQRVVALVSELETIVGAIQPNQPPSTAAAAAAEVLQQLGRIDEAIAWSAFTQGVQPIQPIDAIEQVRQLIVGLPAASGKWTLGYEETPKSLSSSALKTEFQFDDVAPAMGLDFQYYESPDPTTEGNRMFEFTGGGVGVLDYDMDGKADLYFTQGATWGVDVKQRKYLDALYRSVNDQYERVDGLAGIVEPFYSQGVTIGDINNDGFQDIYVANFGPNQLFTNNGDGTFSDESATLPQNSEWTTSCVMADLNGDGTPDLYDVNYLHGEGVDSNICKTTAGARACSPLAFKPTVDRLLLSDGRSFLRNATEEMGMLKPGNGLGVVAANFDADAELELFVANDLMKNFLWDLQGEESSLHFEDASLVNGWAFSSEGNSQACMGVAAADFNGDATTDLFVTNFFNESNTLYLSDESGFAQDRSRGFGLNAPTLPMLGFGTQAIDADLDGDFDLFVVNGDLDDFSHEDRSLLMPPQFFENINNERFKEFNPTKQEGYLGGEYRGRGMAKIDFDRNGVWDLAVSHLDSPVALVKNATVTNNKSIRVKIVGTNSARDAIGAVVTVKSAERTLSQALTAGDGYQASNEKLLIFPASGSELLNVTVLWPQGSVDTWICEPRVSTWLLVEGQNALPLE